jgi:exodeoxyribonuclease V beta subunit
VINPREYQESMTLAGPVHVLEASAGTGKTHAVANLVVRHLLEPRPAKKGKKGEPWQIGEILVVTFTEAAVAELKERIRRQIRSTVLALETGRNLNEISSKHALTPARRTDAIRRLELALSSYDEAPIFTIHGFCKRVLRQFAFESQTEFDLEFMKDSGELLEEVVADYWARHIATRDEALLAFLEERGCTPGELRAAVRGQGGRSAPRALGRRPG